METRLKQAEELIKQALAVMQAKDLPAEPVVRPWKHQDELPALPIEVRWKDGRTRTFVAMANETGLWVGGASSQLSYAEAFEDLEKLDGSCCGITEESK